MKRMISALLAFCILMSLAACTQDPPTPSITDPSQTNPTDPTPTTPPPTEPKSENIRIEAEKPVRKNVDIENRTDAGGNPMDHSYRADLLGADGLHYANDAKTAIMFSAFDSYTYAVQVEKAGTYELHILASCDRDTPIRYSINNSNGTGNFVRNNYEGYDQVKLATVELKAGINTLNVEITENKNHNMMVDCYILIPTGNAGGNDEEDWASIIAAAKEAEKIDSQQANPVWKEFFVAPNGKDTNDGSKNAPFATISGANEAVKNLRNAMQGDIVIHVASGYYPISEPIVIGVDGGGTNGYRVIYRGDRENKPIISGGTQITGWTQNGNIWSAPCQVEDTRTLYVNDNIAVRARSKWLYVFASSYSDGDAQYASDGIIVKHRKFPQMTNLDQVELVFDSEWQHHRYPVENILYSTGKATIEMKQPYWDQLMATNAYATHWPNVGKGFYIENALELLDEPGEFYFDKTTQKIYYYPFPEEDMTTAQCYVGTTETMMQIVGDDKNHCVSGVTFENIQFKYGAWNEVSETGLLTNQADNLKNTANTRQDDRMPAQIHVEYADHITFRGCVFACMGSTALAMENAVSDSVIDGNVFRDISGVAISIGNEKHGLKMDSSLARPIRIDVTNNVIRRAGAEFRSCPAVIAYYVTNVRIMHNDIAQVPYTGISLGWGWGQDVKECKDNIIAYNKIVDVASPTHDGAHIYILSPNYNTYINNNWCVDSGDMRGGIYPDEGSAHLNIFHNVIEDMYKYWLFARPGVNLREIQAFQNYTDTDQIEIDQNHVTMADNVVVTNGQWPQAAKDIMAGAGLMEDYKHLLAGVEYPSWRTDFVKVIPNRY